MPSGSKKRKANKKKKTNPNPNSQTPPPVPLHHQGNGHANGEDGEEEEVFETPRSQPPDPLDVAHLGNGWSPRVPLDEVPEEKRDEEEEEEEEEEREDAVAAVGSLDDEENPVRTEGIVVVEEEPARVEYPKVDEKFVADSARFHKAGAEDPEVSVETVDDSTARDEEEVEIVPWQEGERLADLSESKRDEGLVEMATEKSAREDPSITENHKVLVEEVNTVNVDGQVEEMPKIDDGLKQTNSDRLTVPIEKFTLVTEESLVAVPANHECLVEEVKTVNVDHKVKEIPQIDDGSNKTNSDRFTEESLVGDTVTGIHEILVDGVDSTSHEGEGKELPHVDEGLKDAQLDKLVGEKYTLTENPTLVTEEVNQQSEATAGNLDKILVGIVDTTPTPQEATDCSANAARTEIAPRSEVARGPLVVRRATLWNCCGLLDVFTGSQR